MKPEPIIGMRPKCFPRREVSQETLDREQAQREQLRAQLAGRKPLQSRNSDDDFSAGCDDEIRFLLSLGK